MFARAHSPSLLPWSLSKQTLTSLSCLNARWCEKLRFQSHDRMHYFGSNSEAMKLDERLKLGATKSDEEITFALLLLLLKLV